MVPRYTRPAMAAIWAPENRFRIWFEIDAIEAETRHDVIAFLTWLAEKIGPESRFVHLGMTSSDVLDTCLAVQLVQSTDLLIADVDAVLAALKTRAIEHKH